jgi:hypothetical protein
MAWLIVGLTMVGCSSDAPKAANTSQESTTTTQSPGFASPEAAIKDFADGVRGAELGRALGDFAIEENLAGYDGKASEAYLQALVGLSTRMPGADDASLQVNRWMLQGQAANQVFRLVSSLLAPEVDLDQPTVDPDGSVYSTWASEMKPSRLATLSITDPVAVPGPAVAAKPEYTKIISTQTKIYGADQLVDRVWLYQFDGKSYIGGAQLVHFPNGWKILRLGSPYGNMSSSGVVKPGSQDDIDAMLTG